jgi:hypothetical protein
VCLSSLSNRKRYRDHHRIDEGRAAIFCAQERASLAELLVTYVAILEANPHAWDFIEEVSLS